MEYGPFLTCIFSWKWSLGLIFLLCLLPLVFYVFLLFYTFSHSLSLSLGFISPSDSIKVSLDSIARPLFWNYESWILEVMLMPVSNSNRTSFEILTLAWGQAVTPEWLPLLPSHLPSSLLSLLFMLLAEFLWNFSSSFTLQIQTAMGTSAAMSWTTCSRLLAYLCLGTEWEKLQKT